MSVLVVIRAAARLWHRVSFRGYEWRIMGPGAGEGSRKGMEKLQYDFLALCTTVWSQQSDQYWKRKAPAESSRGFRVVAIEN